jgi:DNA-directed RNA polymerase specialized sigma24 family protein
VLAVSEALEKLVQHDAQKAELVKLRYFAGLTLEEAAAALGLSRATADRHWGYAKTWLYCELTRAAARSAK